jgi:hypothetical protein
MVLLFLSVSICVHLWFQLLLFFSSPCLRGQILCWKTRNQGISMKEDAKKKQKIGPFFRILRVLLRARRDFAFAFLNYSGA